LVLHSIARGASFSRTFIPFIGENLDTFHGIVRLFLVPRILVEENCHQQQTHHYVASLEEYLLPLRIHSRAMVAPTADSSRRTVDAKQHFVGCVVCFHRRALWSHLRLGRCVNHRSSNEIRDHAACHGRISRGLPRKTSVGMKDFKVMHG
jgi:hypothetical protein